MKTATKPKTKTNWLALLETAPAPLLSDLRAAKYYGVAVFQAAGGWTRIGPTWRLPGGEWAVFGPGVARWGTSLGLAELACSKSPTPTLHAVGLGVSPSVNIIYALLDEARANSNLAEVFEIEAAIAGSQYGGGR